MAKMGGKRRRHGQKVDLKNKNFKIEKKRGRVVVTPEVELKRTEEEMRNEIALLKKMKTELRMLKKRRGRLPAPIAKRKALDNMPVDAGERQDRYARIERRLAAKERRAAIKARNEQRRVKREERGKETIDFRDALGGDFFEG